MREKTRIAVGGGEKIAEKKTADSSLIEIMRSEEGLQTIQLALQGLYLAASPSSPLREVDYYNRAEQLKSLFEKLESAIDTQKSYETVVELPFFEKS